MDEFRATVYLNWGRWVADCPRGCGNAEHFGRDPDTGHVGGLTATAYRCGSAGHGCGLLCAADWPDNMAEIEQLVADRVMRNRNWRPDEDLRDLLADNLAHGILPASDAYASVVRRVLAGSEG
jgi:hypothetical protein